MKTTKKFLAMLVTAGIIMAVMSFGVGAASVQLNDVKPMQYHKVINVKDGVIYIPLRMAFSSTNKNGKALDVGYNQQDNFVQLLYGFTDADGFDNQKNEYPFVNGSERNAVRLDLSEAVEITDSGVRYARDKVQVAKIKYSMTDGTPDSHYLDTSSRLSHDLYLENIYSENEMQSRIMISLEDVNTIAEFLGLTADGSTYSVNINE